MGIRSVVRSTSTLEVDVYGNIWVFYFDLRSPGLPVICAQIMTVPVCVYDFHGKGSPDRYNTSHVCDF